MCQFIAVAATQSVRVSNVVIDTCTENPGKMQSQICTDPTGSTMHVQRGRRSRTTAGGIGELVTSLDQGC